jgi:ankyrin repeat protein
MKPDKIGRHFQPTLSLLAFQSLLPGKASSRQYEHNLNISAMDALLEANFTEILVFSMANGFAGLVDMPIAGVFKFLSKYGNVNAVFGQFLQANPRHVAKSLAENLFKAAIEAQESDVIMQLLKTRLVHVNKIVCQGQRRQKLTAAERAAEFRDLETLKVLTDAGADMNKTYSPNVISKGGVLRRLISSINRGETIQDVVDIIPSLREAGAEVDGDMLLEVLISTHHPDFALCLLPSLLTTHDTSLISIGMLSVIAEKLGQEYACEAMSQIIQSCEILHQGDCLHWFEDEVEWALIESAKRGYYDVVQLLLPYARCLDRALTASFRGGTIGVVELILVKNPSFDVPAQSIENGGQNGKTTTPLAEALSTGLDDLTHLCESMGALDHLHLDGHMKAALSAAATIGNSSYVDKLFQHNPKSNDMSTALRSAIQNKHVDISLRLITAGARISTGYTGDPLLDALKQRNAVAVRAMLDWSILDLTNTGNQDDWFYAAIRWGDRALILELNSTFPNVILFQAVLPEEDIPSNKKDFLDFMISIELLDKSALTAYLPDFIKNNETQMVYHLIEAGADPSDSKCLSLAAAHHPSILKILLEHVPRLKKPQKRLGTRTVVESVNRGLDGLESLEILLSSEVVDINGFIYLDGRTGNYNPLGWAISNAVHYKGNFPVVQRLLEAGCNPNGIVAVPIGAENYTHSSNMTALLAALQTRNTELVELLLSSGAMVNTEAKRALTRTPLQLAAELGCLEIVQLLIKEGAQVNALPALRGGGTALQLAAISGNCNIAAELLSLGADPEALPSALYGTWPIEGAAEHGRLDMTDYLLKVTVFNAKRCRRAMELAQENGHIGCHDLIMEHVQRQEREEGMGTMGLAEFI